MLTARSIMLVVNTTKYLETTIPVAINKITTLVNCIVSGRVYSHVRDPKAS